jgi:hypothetical protein
MNVIAKANTRPAAQNGRVDIAGWGLIGGGLLFALGNLLHPLEHSDAAYQASTWEIAHLLVFLSLPLLVLGLPALHQMLQRRGVGRIAGPATILAVIGLVGMAPGLVAEAYLAPRLGFEAMQELERTGFGIVAGTLPLAWVLSSIPLALACRRAHVGPSWAPAALVIVSLMLLASPALPGAAGGAVIIGSTAVYGGVVAVLGWQVRTA